jgi:predicted DNA-binding protein
MSNTVSISAQIPEELGKILEQISRDEERSKSYYVKKGLEHFLKQRQEAIQLEKNIALSLQQIEGGGCHEANDEFWQTLKNEVVQEIETKKKIL